MLRTCIFRDFSFFPHLHFSRSASASEKSRNGKKNREKSRKIAKSRTAHDCSRIARPSVVYRSASSVQLLPGTASRGYTSGAALRAAHSRDSRRRPKEKKASKSTAFHGVFFMRSPSGFLRGYVIFERFSRFFRVFYSIPFRIIKAIHEKSQRARRHNARTPKPETGKFLFGFRKNR